jgi:hypothetical protein
MKKLLSEISFLEAFNTNPKSIKFLNEVSFAQAQQSLAKKVTKNAAKQYVLNHIYTPDALEQRGMQGMSPKEIFSLGPVKQYIEDYRAKFAKNVLEFIPKDIEDSQKGLTLHWLIRLAKNEDGVMFNKVLEARPHVTHDWRGTLEKFFIWQQFMAEKDLNRIAGFGALITVTDDANARIKEYRDAKKYGDAKAGTQTFREDNTWHIAALHNKGAACKLGSDDWCTAAPGLDYFADYYGGPDDPLFYFENKKSGRKWQFVYGYQDPHDRDATVGAFMDDKDHPVSDAVFNQLHGMLVSLINIDSYPALKKRHLIYTIETTSDSTVLEKIVNDKATYDNEILLKFLANESLTAVILDKLVENLIVYEFYSGRESGYAVDRQRMVTKKVAMHPQTSPESIDKLTSFFIKKGLIRLLQLVITKTGATEKQISSAILSGYPPRRYLNSGAATLKNDPSFYERLLDVSEKHDEAQNKSKDPNEHELQDLTDELGEVFAYSYTIDSSTLAKIFHHHVETLKRYHDPEFDKHTPAQPGVEHDVIYSGLADNANTPPEILDMLLTKGAKSIYARDLNLKVTRNKNTSRATLEKLTKYPRHQISSLAAMRLVKMTQREGKMNEFYRQVSRSILGFKTNIKLKGSPKLVEATRLVIAASRNLHDLLENTNNLKKINEAVNIKNKAAQNFKEITGKTWLL